MHPEPYAPELEAADIAAGRDPQRFFSDAQRVILFARANGICQWRGEPLNRHWHADHRIPWSQGGPTHVDNGQALCHDCNIEKGNDLSDCPVDLQRNQWTVGPWPLELQPREWARRFLAEYQAHAERDFLLVATPGAGKTLATLAAIHGRFTRGEIDRVVIVAPTDNVRTQWCAEAARVGIELAPSFIGPPLWPWQNGIAITYAALLTADLKLADLCARERVMLVLDEVHHAAESKEWGHSLAAALNSAAGAAYRLSLSGTPFRTDRLAIVGVRTQPTADDPSRLTARHDFDFTYEDALLAGDVVREVFFARFDGEVSWVSRYAPDEIQTATFADDLRPHLAQERLRAALTPHGAALRSMLESANERLEALVQRGDPRAQGLVACVDGTHATEVRAMLTEITGTAPTIVASDILGSAEALRDFGRSDARWLVSIRMASEGYDNRRLRVGVYASTWTTDMYFLQFVGRFIRYNPALGEMLRQPSFVYLPDDPRLMRIARQILEAQEAVIPRRGAPWAGDEVVEARTPRPPTVPDPTRGFRVVDAHGALVGIDLPGGESIEADALAGFDQFVDGRPLAQPDYLLAARLLKEQQRLLRREMGADFEWDDGVAA